MQKKISFLICCVIIATFCGCSSGTMAAVLTVSSSSSSYDISDNLYGIFFEDINHAADGGLNANLIQNDSFEYSYCDRADDETRKSFWQLCDGASLDYTNNFYETNPTVLKLTVDGNAQFANVGYRDLADDLGVYVRDGQTYELTFWVDANEFVGSISAFFENGDGKRCSNIVSVTPSNGFMKYSLIQTASSTDYTKLVLSVDGKGTLYFDCFSLVSTSSFGYDDDVWQYTCLREDLVQALKNLSPSFLRFPGGCVAEGAWDFDNMYDWKSTIGAIETRDQKPNLWGYNQSYGIGFYEYFCLAEELGATPIPVVAAGLLCQARCNMAYDIESEEFIALVEDVLDLIEYATGDITTEWGARRAEDGHPEPFDLKYISIGNENWDGVYFEHFEYFYNAIRGEYPNITIISSSGPSADGELFDYGWSVIRSRYSDVVVDEHYYVSSETLTSFATRYDEYPRTTKVFVGEYAAHSEMFSWSNIIDRNNLDSALSEAVFLTGIERNGDVVDMACYAPLLAKRGYISWAPNLIWFDSREVIKTPNYYVQSLFASNIGTLYQPSTITEGLYSSITVDNAERKMYIKLVNPTDDEVDLQMAFGDYGVVDGKYAMQYVSGDELRDFNDVGMRSVYPSASIVRVSNGGANAALAPYSVSVLVVDYS